jgi:hypothetical protein
MAAYAFTLIGCASGYTLAHELGHNQGCGHNFNEDGKIRTGYAFGWRRCDLGPYRSFKTIMRRAAAARAGRRQRPVKLAAPRQRQRRAAVVARAAPGRAVSCAVCCVAPPPKSSAQTLLPSINPPP